MNWTVRVKHARGLAEREVTQSPILRRVYAAAYRVGYTRLHICDGVRVVLLVHRQNTSWQLRKSVHCVDFCRPSWLSSGLALR